MMKRESVVANNSFRSSINDDYIIIIAVNCCLKHSKQIDNSHRCINVHSRQEIIRMFEALKMYVYVNVLSHKQFCFYNRCIRNRTIVIENKEKIVYIWIDDQLCHTFTLKIESTTTGIASYMCNQCSVVRKRSSTVREKSIHLNSDTIVNGNSTIEHYTDFRLIDYAAVHVEDKLRSASLLVRQRVAVMAKAQLEMGQIMTLTCGEKGINEDETSLLSLNKPINSRLSKMKKSGIAAAAKRSTSDCDVRGMAFLRFTSDDGKTKLFIDDNGIEFLRICPISIADATYYSTSIGSKQMLIVIERHSSGESVPPVYALMKRRKQLEYQLNQLIKLENR